MMMDDGRLAQKVAQLMGNAVTRAIIGMVATGALDKPLGIQILKKVEEGIQEMKEQLLQEEREEPLNPPTRRQANA